MQTYSALLAHPNGKNYTVVKTSESESESEENFSIIDCNSGEDYGVLNNSFILASISEPIQSIDRLHVGANGQIIARVTLENNQVVYLDAFDGQERSVGILGNSDRGHFGPSGQAYCTSNCVVPTKLYDLNTSGHVASSEEFSEFGMSTFSSKGDFYICAKDPTGTWGVLDVSKSEFYPAPEKPLNLKVSADGQIYIYAGSYQEADLYELRYILENKA